MKVLGQDIISTSLGLAGLVGGSSKWLKSLGSFGFPSNTRLESPSLAWAKGRNSEASLVGVPGLPGMKQLGIRGIGMWATASTGNVGLAGNEAKDCCAGSGKTGKGAGESELAEVVAEEVVVLSDKVDLSLEVFAFFGR